MKTAHTVDISLNHEDYQSMGDLMVRLEESGHYKKVAGCMETYIAKLAHAAATEYGKSSIEVFRYLHQAWEEKKSAGKGC